MDFAAEFDAATGVARKRTSGPGPRRSGELDLPCLDPELFSTESDRFAEAPSFQPSTWPGKRLFDVGISVLAAPAALLVIVIAGIAVGIMCGRPIFFFQDRVGLHGRLFKILKIRTMYQGAEPVSATQIADKRITRIGRFLRKFRIDELPQILNILRGDMSLIGPRPEQPFLVEAYRNEIAGFDERHLLRPGLTGLAQVRLGYAGDLETTRVKVKYDRFYVRRCSFALDMKIALSTIKIVLCGKGAR